MRTNLVSQKRDGGNVVAFALAHRARHAERPSVAQERRAYAGLTRALLLQKARDGQLEPELLAYILDAAGIAQGDAA